jgi:hypothetical protein
MFAVTDGNRFGAHGKEGVDGSSPSEGVRSRAGIIDAAGRADLQEECGRGCPVVSAITASEPFPYRASSHAALGLCKPIRAVVTPS